MPTTTSEDRDLLLLLRRSGAGDEAARRELFEVLYRELRLLARRQLARERRGHTLAPTSLVHEVFLRLHSSALPVEDRRQFLSFAATVMRNVLVDSARRHRCRNVVESSAAAVPSSDADDERILRLEAAMQRLAIIDPQLYRVVELRFLIGLGVAQAAEILECSSATVKRDWRTARAFLQREIERVTR